MKTWLLELFLDQNNEADETFLFAVCLVGTFFANSLYSVWVLQVPFDAQAFGVGGGALLGGIAAGMGAKAKLERKE